MKNRTLSVILARPGVLQSWQARLAAVFSALALLAWVWPARGASFGDDFEAYAQGYLDANYVGGPNATSNGTGSNPWWGANPADFFVVGSENGVTPHSGAQDGPQRGRFSFPGRVFR